MANGSHFRFNDDNKIKYTITIVEMGKLNKYSPIYCMKDNCHNWLHLRNTNDRMHLSSIFEVQYLNKRVRISGHNVLYYLHTPQDCTIIKWTTTPFPGYIWNRDYMLVQPPYAHNHEKYDNNGKGWYSLFDYYNKMCYRYILSFSLPWMVKINT